MTTVKFEGKLQTEASKKMVPQGGDLILHIFLPMPFCLLHLSRGMQHLLSKKKRRTMKRTR
jgi:hypothetical protein